MAARVVARARLAFNWEVTANMIDRATAMVQCLPGPARICSSAATFEQWSSATNYDEF